MLGSKSLFMSVFVPIFAKRFFQSCTFFATSLNPLPKTMLKELQKRYHGASLMATVKWSQVKSWPNISDEARFSLSALSITLEAHYSSSLPLLPLLLSLYLILFLSMVPPPPELRRSSFFLTSVKESILYQLYFLYSASHNLNRTKYKVNLCSRIPLLHSISLKTPFQKIVQLEKQFCLVCTIISL